jgi:hypothetical protein
MKTCYLCKKATSKNIKAEYAESYGPVRIYLCKTHAIDRDWKRIKKLKDS